MTFFTVLPSKKGRAFSAESAAASISGAVAWAGI